MSVELGSKTRDVISLSTDLQSSRGRCEALQAALQQAQEVIIPQQANHISLLQAENDTMKSKYCVYEAPSTCIIFDYDKTICTRSYFFMKFGQTMCAYDLRRPGRT